LKIETSLESEIIGVRISATMQEKTHIRNCIIPWNCSHARKTNGPVRMHLSFSPLLSPGDTFGHGMCIGAYSFMHFIRGRRVPKELSRRSRNLNRSTHKSASVICEKSFEFFAPESRECSVNSEACNYQFRDAYCTNE